MGERSAQSCARCGAAPVVEAGLCQDCVELLDDDSEEADDDFDDEDDFEDDDEDDDGPEEGEDF